MHASDLSVHASNLSAHASELSAHASELSDFTSIGSGACFRCKQFCLDRKRSRFRCQQFCLDRNRSRFRCKRSHFVRNDACFRRKRFHFVRNRFPRQRDWFLHTSKAFHTVVTVVGSGRGCDRLRRESDTSLLGFPPIVFQEDVVRGGKQLVFRRFGVFDDASFPLCCHWTPRFGSGARVPRRIPATLRSSSI